MPADPSIDTVPDGSVTPFVRKTAAWSWRLLVIFSAIVAVLWTVKKLELIVVPVALATLLAALLLPVVDFLDRRGAPRGGAVTLVLLGVSPSSAESSRSWSASSSRGHRHSSSR